MIRSAVAMVIGLGGVAAVELVRARSRGCPGLCPDAAGLVAAGAPLAVGALILATSSRDAPRDVGKGLAAAGAVALGMRVALNDELEARARAYQAEIDRMLGEPAAPVEVITV